MELLGFKAKANVKACIIFEKLAKKPMSELQGVEDMVYMMRAMIIAGEGKEPKGLKDKLEDLSLNELTEATNAFTFFQAVDNATDSAAGS